MTRFSPETRGSLAMLGAMALFVVNDALVKSATQALPVSQVLAVRGLFASLVMLGLVVAFGQFGQLKRGFRPRVLGRAALEGLVAVTFISALAHLPLANITAILQASSLIIVALAAVLGLDRIGWRRALAVVVGFIGVLLVVKPSAEGFTVYSLLALVSAILVAVRDLVTRKIASDVPSGVVAFITTTAVMLTGLAMAAFEPWAALALREALFLAGAAVVVGLGNLCIIVAYRDGDVTLVSGLRYSVLVFALIMGFFAFGEWPDALALTGAGLIVGSGLYALHRQRVKRQAQAKEQAQAEQHARRDAASAA